MQGFQLHYSLPSLTQNHKLYIYLYYCDDSCSDDNKDGDSNDNGSYDPSDGNHLMVTQMIIIMMILSVIVVITMTILLLSCDIYIPFVDLRILGDLRSLCMMAGLSEWRYSIALATSIYISG